MRQAAHGSSSRTDGARLFVAELDEATKDATDLAKLVPGLTGKEIPP